MKETPLPTDTDVVICTSVSTIYIIKHMQHIAHI